MAEPTRLTLNFMGGKNKIQRWERQIFEN